MHSICVIFWRWSHPLAHSQNAIRWLQWLLRKLSIMSIPGTPELPLIFGTGSAVAVERVFSVGRDTISL
jgi:hypothetical protein